MTVTPGNAPIVRQKTAPQTIAEIVFGEGKNGMGQIKETVEKIVKDEKPAPKKKFVRKPHLTDRPFADNMDLLRLRTNLEQKQRRQQRVNIKKK